MDKERIIEKNWKLYKLNLIIDKTATDLHHILWQMNKDKYNVKAKENIVRIPRREHIALNNYFGKIQEARGQLIKVFELVKPVLSPWVREVLDTVLFKTDDEMFYIPEVLKNGRNKKKRMERWEWCMQELNTDEGKL